MHLYSQSTFPVKARPREERIVRFLFSSWRCILSHQIPAVCQCPTWQVCGARLHNCRGLSQLFKQLSEIERAEVCLNTVDTVPLPDCCPSVLCSLPACLSSGKQHPWSQGASHLMWKHWFLFLRQDLWLQTPCITEATLTLLPVPPQTPGYLHVPHACLVSFSYCSR